MHIPCSTNCWSYVEGRVEKRLLLAGNERGLKGGKYFLSFSHDLKFQGLIGRNSASNVLFCSPTNPLSHMHASLHANAPNLKQTSHRNSSPTHSAHYTLRSNCLLYFMLTSRSDGCRLLAFV